MLWHVVKCGPKENPNWESFSLPEPLCLPALLAGTVRVKAGGLLLAEPGPDKDWATVYVITDGYWTQQALMPGPIIRQFLASATFARGEESRLEYRVGSTGESGRVEPVPPGGFRVIVGNVGTVYDGRDLVEANRVYREYVEQSTSGRGRAGGESVTLFEGDDMSREHPGTVGG